MIHENTFHICNTHHAIKLLETDLVFMDCEQQVRSITNNMITKNVESGEMTQWVSSHLGLHC